MPIDARRPPRARRATHLAAAAVLALLAAGCPGGGGDDRGQPASAAFAARCALPRTGLDPFTGATYPDVQGTRAEEKQWIRSWIDELYLWYREVPDPNPASFVSPQEYFAVLRTSARTPSGRPKDNFHFWIPTAEWQALSQAGEAAGYGVLWALLEAAPPRLLLAAHVEPGSPAAAAGIARGTEVLAIDRVDLVSGTDVEALNAGLFPAGAGEVHAFSIRDAAGSRTVSLTSGIVALQPVPVVQTLTAGAATVGYLLFNDHVMTSEAALVSAFETLQAAGVSDLVLDLRYNGGGYLAIASQVAYMIAGPARTAGKTFERLVYNDRYPGIDPFGGAPNLPFPFLGETIGFSLPAGAALPSLGLGRVFVLTGGGTCSASEAIVNGLRGIGVQVIQIGATTCGKPYGFYPADNCGTTYFAIQFQGVNHAGFGDYADGFAPGGAGPAGVPGCAVPDDFGRALGDPAEARLAAALAHRATGACPPAGAAAKLGPAALAGEGVLLRSPAREARIVTR